MRFLWAGLIVLSLTTSALAQATGYVRELGFVGNYRPDCWTPLLVHLESSVSEPAEYQIQIHQQDLDQDNVVFTRTVTLGPQARENVWVYFQPQPTDGGLPEQNASALLGDVLKVHLYDKTGKTHIANLPVQARATSVDQGGGGTGSSRAVKVVLVVAEQGNYHAQEYSGAVGVIEDVLFVPIRVDMLPDHVLGYQMVDGVLWLDAKLNAIRNTPALGALQQWVRQGGNFAICQQTDRTQLDALIDADMLPVIAKVGPEADAAWAIQQRQIVARPVKDSDNKDKGYNAGQLEHLKAIVRETGLFSTQIKDLPAWEAVERAHPTFDVAYAQPRPDAMVDAWIVWPTPEGAPEERSPLIARRSYGLGSVAWVAQDLGSSKLNSAPDPNDKPTQPNARPRTLMTNGWPRIWDRVFGWRNQTRTVGDYEAAKSESLGTQAARDNFQARVDEYAGGSGIDIGLSMFNRGTEHGSRSTAYVFLVVVFFIIYWVVAGPGSYLYLAGKKKKGLSWTIFGASALVATLLTVVLVKVLLRGGAEARHVTLVRLTPDAPAADGTARFSAAMHSRVGLYIPSDGEQIVALDAPGADKYAAVSPYAIHPQWLKGDKDAGFTDTAKYFVNTDLILAGKAPSVGFPYRSTLKKIEARWSGQIAEGITGDVALTGNATTPLSGKLVNSTGRDLVHTYLVFSAGGIDANMRSNDQVLFVPNWKNGDTLDLAKEYPNAKDIAGLSPGYGNVRISGRIDPVQTSGWSRFWYDRLSTSLTSSVFDDRSDSHIRSFPMMALIDRIGPMRRRSNDSDTRPEPIRRGGREFNASQLVASGRLVILAQAKDAPVPLPMTVNENKLEGTGVTFYEVSLPLNRDKFKPATAPAK